MDIPETSDEAKRMLGYVLDAIQMGMSIEERHKLLLWADKMRDIALWGLPGMEVMIGIHNMCVHANLTEDPAWNGADYYVID